MTGEQIELEDAIGEATLSEKVTIKTDSLLALIDKYNLSGYTDKAYFMANGDNLEIKTIDSNGALAIRASIKCKNILNIDKDFGIFNSKQFINLIKLFDKDITIQFNTVYNELDSMVLSSTESSGLEVNVNLADPVLFNRATVNKQFINESKLPKTYEIILDLSSDIINKFMKISDAFTDDRLFSFVIKRKKLYLTFGNESTRSNVASIPLAEDEDGYSPFNNKISFLISDFRRVLKANKNAKMRIKVSIAGLILLTSTEDEITSTYYMAGV